MLALSKKVNRQAKKKVFNKNETSFLSMSTNYPQTSRLKTESPQQILTQRTKISYQTDNTKNKNEEQFSKTINFQTIKKKIIFNKNSIKRHLQDQKQKLFRSLDSYDYKRNNSKEPENFQIQKNIKLKANIQTKNSNSIQGFFKSKIKAYGISTFKSKNNITNNHFMSIHLGKVKQFILIQNIDGFSTGSLVKKQLPIDILKYNLQNSKKKLPTQSTSKFINKNQNNNMVSLKSDINILQDSILQAFEQISRKIFENQQQIHDNSGCFVNGAFIIENYVLVANSGTGSAFYFSKDQKLKQFCSVHNTFNVKQLERITSNRGKIYQTQFNLKFKTEMGIKGPIRVYPNGTTYTRILGKTFDKINKKSQNPEYQKVYLESPIIQQPEISYAKAEDIQWIVILSSGIAQFLGKTLICSIILYQISKYGQNFTIHDLAGQCSKSIINQAIIRGFQQTMSVQVIILNLNIDRVSLYKQLQQKKQQQKKNKLKKQPQSLKYIGKRKNFIMTQIWNQSSNTFQ